jgi:hypothetical protein
MYLVTNSHFLRFSEVFLIDASSEETIESELKNISLATGTGDSAEDTLRWLARRHKEWLLLFEGADDISLNLHKYFPRSSIGNIIVTSRNIETRIHAPIPRSNANVTSLIPDDARDLLLNVAGMIEEENDETRRVATAIVKVCCFTFKKFFV